MIWPVPIQRAVLRGLAGLVLALGVAALPMATLAQQADAPTDVPATPKSGSTGTVTPKGGGFALTKTQTAATPAAKSGKTISVLPSDANAPDYAAWDRLATRAEAATADRGTSNAGLELLRGQLVDWRAALSVAQSANSTRISTLRTQIAALGPLPADGAIEAEEIAARRKTLTDQLVRLQAPGIAADEAYSRADGLIREIDRQLRERQADELLKLWPSPMNPANWPAAAAAVGDVSVKIWTELRTSWARGDKREAFYGNLPLVLGLLAFAVALIWRGRSWIEGVALRLQEHASARGRKIWAFLASLGLVVVPTLGVFLLVVALELTELTGTLGSAVLITLPGSGLTLFVAYWLGGRVFPLSDGVASPLLLSAEQRAEGRFLALMMGLTVGLNALRKSLFDSATLNEAATAVLTLPLLVVAGVLLWRMGRLLSRHVAGELAAGDTLSYRNRLLGFLGRGAVVIGVIGPLLAAIGYVSAAAALVFPAMMTLGLLALLFILLQLVNDLHVLITRSEDEAQQQALVPVLVGFGLTLLSVPLFALIWGARADDLTELWTRFREGYQMGETRISPTDFLYFLIVFGFGFMLTRLFQGALKTSVLPKTSLDQGGQNAVVSGVGYLGIFLAALIAINAAGIDLSGLAIVAGALSVGIGFGLQNIVSNFVSGIILLIERPVSEGDWIEVGTVSGTVKAISVRSTRIQTFDRSDVIVPNADLVSQRVTNWTRFNLTGRLIVPVSVVHGTDPRRVEAILRTIAEAQPMAVLNPPPTIALMGFTMDGMNFEVRVILRDVNFQLSVRNAINHAILTRFAEAGISLAHTGASASPLTAVSPAPVAPQAVLPVEVAPGAILRPISED